MMTIYNRRRNTAILLQERLTVICVASHDRLSHWIFLHAMANSVASFPDQLWDNIIDRNPITVDGHKFEILLPNVCTASHLCFSVLPLVLSRIVSRRLQNTSCRIIIQWYKYFLNIYFG